MQSLIRKFSNVAADLERLRRAEADLEVMLTSFSYLVTSCLGYPLPVDSLPNDKILY